MGLSPDFTDIIEKHNKNDLPSNWLSYDLNDLILPAKAHLELKQDLRQHNKNYKLYFEQQEKSQSPTTPSKTPNTTNTPRQLNPKDQDRQNRIRQAITNHSFRVDDFVNEVRPNCCVWHNTADVISMCHVIKNLLNQANTSDIPKAVDQRSTSSVSKLTSPTHLPQTTSRISSPPPKIQAVQSDSIPATIPTNPQTPSSTAYVSTHPEPFPDAEEISHQITNLNEFDLNNKSESHHYSNLSISYHTTSENP